MGKAFDRFHYAALMQAKQHDEAIDYVDQFRNFDPSNSQLKHFSALARGAKGERILESSDRMGITPSSGQQEEMIQIFREAIEIDPTLADPYWDLAVIHGRFRHNAMLSRQHLDQARKLSYQHPMMKALEAMIT